MLLTLLAPVLLALSGPAQASCGLEVCPLDAAPTGPDRSLQGRVLVRHTAAPDSAAWYTESFLGGSLMPTDRLQLGASVPLLLVQDAYGPWVGLGNSIATVDGAILDRSALTGAVGLQLELPTTTRDTHDDGGHLVALPYARVAAGSGAVDVRVRAGWARVLALSDDHAHPDMAFSPAVEVNPHTDSELLLRLEGGATLTRGPARLRLAAGAQHIRPAEEAPLLAASPVLEVALARLLLRGQVELPLTEPHRFSRRLTLNVTFQ